MAEQREQLPFANRIEDLAREYAPVGTYSRRIDEAVQQTNNFLDFMGPLSDDPQEWRVLQAEYFVGYLEEDLPARIVASMIINQHPSFEDWQWSPTDKRYLLAYAIDKEINHAEGYFVGQKREIAIYGQPVAYAAIRPFEGIPLLREQEELSSISRLQKFRGKIFERVAPTPHTERK